MSSSLYRTSLTSPHLLTALRKMLSNSLVSRHTERAYLGAFDDLFLNCMPKRRTTGCFGMTSWTSKL